MQPNGTAPKHAGGRPRGPRVTITCVICGTTRDVKPSTAARGAKFCSNACALASRIPTEQSVHDRVWSKIQKTDTSWLWTGAKNSMGYGHFLLSKTPPVYKLVSHYVWWERTGHWPVKGEAILHTCDTTCGTVLCVRNDDEGTYEVRGRILPRWGHLALGTSPINNEDMSDKGRRAKGRMYKSAKLTDDSVREAVLLSEQGWPQARIATKLGVSQITISRVLRRLRWSHVHQELTADSTRTPRTS